MRANRVGGHVWASETVGLELRYDTIDGTNALAWGSDPTLATLNTIAAFNTGIGRTEKAEWVINAGATGNLNMPASTYVAPSIPINQDDQNVIRKTNLLVHFEGSVTFWSAGQWLALPWMGFANDPINAVLAGRPTPVMQHRVLPVNGFNSEDQCMIQWNVTLGLRQYQGAGAPLKNLLLGWFVRNCESNPLKLFTFKSRMSAHVSSQHTRILETGV